MKPRPPRALLGILLASVLAAGCGHSAAPPPTPNAGPQPTPISTELTTYASIMILSLKVAIEAGTSVLSKMRQRSYIQQVGNDCSQAGDTISNAKSTFLGMRAPPQARSAYEKAHLGFHYSLASLDECGVASDAGDRRLMRTAISDLTHALALLSSARSTLSVWDRAKS